MIEALNDYLSDPNAKADLANAVAQGQTYAIAAALVQVESAGISTFIDSLTLAQGVVLAAEGVAWGATDVLTGGASQWVASGLGSAVAGGEIGEFLGEAQNSWNTYQAGGY